MSQPKMFTSALIMWLIFLSELLLGVWGFLLLEKTSLLIQMELFASFFPGVSGVIMIDYISSLFGSSVGFIASSVGLFSLSYMKKETSPKTFYFLVGVFVGSMVLFIFSSDLLFAMIGWDGLGVSSFLLVIYYHNKNSWNAGILTLLSNRIGDLLLMFSLVGFIWGGGSSYLWLLQAESSDWNGFLFSLSVASCTKSAQMPFSAWLPAAMAAPTPVSALVHSSTLVTAGVYLVVRFSPLLGSDKMVLTMLFILGGGTMMMAGVMAMYESDFKKIVALSTLSQLGMMMSCVGAGLPDLAFFHLLTHAIFKSLLFVSVGGVMHSMSGGQDLRLGGPIMKDLPVTSSLIMVSTMSLMGLPFLSGFYSKDALLEKTLESSLNWGGVFLLLGGCVFTFMYSFRSIFHVFSFNSRHVSLSWKGESDLELSGGAGGQAVLSVGGGAVLAKVWEFELSHFYLTQSAKTLILMLLLFSLFFWKMLSTMSRSSLKSVGSLFSLQWSAKTSGSAWSMEKSLELQKIDLHGAPMVGFGSMKKTLQKLNYFGNLGAGWQGASSGAGWVLGVLLI